ncbi:hypothetical protein MJ575_01805 [Klebsiella pneumoniae]|nr:hypothetical protein MJ575_01805 [Klebsiella pneumoniae]
MIRILLLFKQGNRELKRLVHPNAVYSIKLGKSGAAGTYSGSGMGILLRLCAGLYH